VAAVSLSDLARELFADLFNQLRDLEDRVGALDRRLSAILAGSGDKPVIICAAS
jgi:hypothetical protein